MNIPWALITGASSGVGAELARQLAAKGLNVAVAARRKERLATAVRTYATRPYLWPEDESVGTRRHHL